jgi:glycosyltransferase involved in cell wall biosynthesis
MTKKGKKGGSVKPVLYPFVSVCTPTYNRRPFIPFTIKCFLNQSYPRDRMEWIIIDDGTDPIEDLVKDVPQVKYFRYEEKMTLGKKRNLMHEKCIGDIIVYMDDDDYYPPERVSHAVHMLQTNKTAMCAGASELYLYFKHISQMYQFGPYGPRHATAGTFAFRKELLKTSRYDDDAALAEEKSFLKNYTVPFVQLEPKKTILVFSHIHNTFDKRKLLAKAPNPFCKPSTKTVDDFIKEPDMKTFYMTKIDEQLEGYEPGLPKHKPDVLEQTKRIEEERRLRELQNAQKKIYLRRPDGTEVPLGEQDMIQLIEKIQQEKAELDAKMLKTETNLKIQTMYLEEVKRTANEKEEILKRQLMEKEERIRVLETTLHTNEEVANPDELRLYFRRDDGFQIELGKQDMIKIITKNEEEKASLSNKIIEMQQIIENQTKIITELIMTRPSQSGDIINHEIPYNIQPVLPEPVLASASASASASAQAPTEIIEFNLSE